MYDVYIYITIQHIFIYFIYVLISAKHGISGDPGSLQLSHRVSAGPRGVWHVSGPCHHAWQPSPRGGRVELLIIWRLSPKRIEHSNQKATKTHQLI
jgi:hypothetical protein